MAAYLSGASGPDVHAVAIALEHAQAVLPPVVLTELIAQSCLDHDLPLVTRDSDFRHFVRLAGVRLVAGPSSG